MEHLHSVLKLASQPDRPFHQRGPLISEQTPTIYTDSTLLPGQVDTGQTVQEGWSRTLRIVHNSTQGASAQISKLLSKLERPFQALSHLMHLVPHHKKLKTSASLKFHPSRVCIAEGCTETEPRHAFAFNNTDNDPPWHANVLNTIRYILPRCRFHTNKIRTTPSIDDIDHR